MLLLGEVLTSGSQVLSPTFELHAQQTAAITVKAVALSEFYVTAFGE